MNLPRFVAFLQRGIKRMRLFAHSPRYRCPKFQKDGLPDHIIDPPERVLVDVDIEKTSPKPRFRLLRKRALAGVMRRKSPYQKFENRPTERRQQKRIRFEFLKDSTMKKRRKSRRMRAFRKHAKRAVEYLAMGVASSAAGYGMPPGFNPNAFRPANQHDYPEVYSAQQLRWMCKTKREMCTVVTASVF
ncbi:hypothetical protein BIW11_00348 [Tropilaelaps mercedesae]|uniref:Uncharacterized protein n=1 Tax=Tropilaelaps mercedesae TaxID=418985 RepID=A0A1V9XXT8_9ACAR|nr:hypothetical protein BIW11_00348 [Tropilaelaps mercedesae]